MIEAPPMLQALLDDFWHRPLEGPTIDGIGYLGDIGLPGPDRGAGGRYLIVPAGHEVDTGDEDYFVYTSRTNGVFIFLRGFFSSTDDLAPGVAAVEGITIGPLSGDAVPMTFAPASDVVTNALFPADGTYFDMLHDFIQSERVDAVDPYMHGMLAAIGITKGQPFTPTDRERELLDAAARTAWKMAKSIAADYDTSDKGRWWDDRRWVAHVRTELDDFMATLLDEEFRTRTTGHTDVDAKAHMFVNHYSTSTGMMSSIVGKGAKYTNTYKDSEGDYLRGEHTYRIDLPTGAPAGLFWSLTVYDAETAAGVDADGQVFPSLNSMDDLAYNSDGSITIHVAPRRPEDALNWIASVPERGWFGLIRWYGPTEAFFERRYKPGDFERVDPGESA